jgi:hypothetical protein
VAAVEQVMLSLDSVEAQVAEDVVMLAVLGFNLNPLQEDLVMLEEHGQKHAVEMPQAVAVVLGPQRVPHHH